MGSVVIAALVLLVGLRAVGQLRRDPRYTRRVMGLQIAATGLFLGATIGLLRLASWLAGPPPVEGPMLLAIVGGALTWMVAGTWLLALYLRRIL